MKFSWLGWFDIRQFNRRQKIHFYANLLIGFSIIFFSHYFANSAWSERITDGEFDDYIKSEAKAEVAEYNNTGSLTKASRDIVFFDIDHPTFRKWGKPSITPRDELANLMAIAAGGKAKVIVIDILLNRDDYRPPAEIARLQSVIRDIKEKGQTKIIIPVLIDSDKELAPTIIDDLIDNETCFKAVSMLIPSKQDFVRRYWYPYATYNGGVLPGVPLLAAVLAYGNRDTLAKLQNELIEGKGSISFTGPAGASTFVFSDGNEHTFQQRIRYHLIPDGGPGRPGNLTTAVRKVSDGPGLLAADTPFLTLAGKIVIIGNSSPDKGDVHRTPLGDMQGMYILGNVINTVTMGLQPRPIRTNIVMEIGLVLALAFLFVYTTDLVFVLVTIPIFIFGSYLSYRYFLEHGIFISLVFPVVIAGMGLHHLFARFEEAMGYFRQLTKKLKKEVDK